MSTPETRTKVHEAEVSAVKEYLASLSPDDLQRPSACVDWSVADVLAHLAGQPHASVIRRGLEEDYSPPEGSPAVADHDEAPGPGASMRVTSSKAAAVRAGSNPPAATPQRGVAAAG